MNDTSKTNHYFCCLCHLTSRDHCEECKPLCQPASKTELDAQLVEILNTHRSETWTHGWNGDATEKAKAALTALIAQQKQEQLRRFIVKYSSYLPQDIADQLRVELKKGIDNE